MSSGYADSSCGIDHPRGLQESSSVGCIDSFRSLDDVQDRPSPERLTPIVASAHGRLSISLRDHGRAEIKSNSIMPMDCSCDDGLHESRHGSTAAGHVVDRRAGVQGLKALGARSRPVSPDAGRGPFDGAGCGWLGGWSCWRRPSGLVVAPARPSRYVRSYTNESTRAARNLQICSRFPLGGGPSAYQG